MTTCWTVYHNIVVEVSCFSAALVALAYLNLNRCGLSDDGCDKFSGESRDIRILRSGSNFGILDLAHV